MIIAFCWFHVKQIPKYLFKVVGYLLQVIVLIGFFIKLEAYRGGKFSPADKSPQSS
jgi:hypothetical protein